MWYVWELSAMHCFWWETIGLADPASTQDEKVIVQKKLSEDV